ncbi:unnamed protein product [Phytomonas sp. EM1]|nr:unnamed protein product [Phytomonas sp. EM1]|eukprot:CCW64648.1 unnamed protein product [Phytomonas sp. isolate EM1]
MGQSKTKLNIIICGLDNSGKTTIVNQLKPQDQRTENITATVGYNMDKFSLDKVKFTAFDMGGARKFRALWESYYSSVQGIVFVIDSSDALRLCVVKDEISQMVEHPEIANKKLPFLFFANKMDVKNSKAPVDLIQALELQDLMTNHSFNIFASNALTGSGLTEGITWLQDVMLKRNSKKKEGS